MPPPSNRRSFRDSVLVDAYRVTNREPNIGRAETKYDNAAATAATHSETITSVNQYYSANRNMLNAAAKGFASLEPKVIENAISKFNETVKIVINGLDALAQVHPFIKVAVVPFKLVITLDMKRRESNQKVIALRVQMQDMMCVLFQLRHMKDPDSEGPDGKTIQDRMQELIKTIAENIQKCGSACDAYLKKSFLSRTLKSQVYERRLVEWASTFAEHRTQLEKALAIHTAIGVDKANQKLDIQQTTLKNIEAEMTRMADIFKKLDTPREKEINKFLEEHGGAKACIEQDDLLTKLIAKSGESLTGVLQRSTTKGTDDSIVAARKKLLKEIAEDVDDVFKKNFEIFEAKMTIQYEHIEHMMDRQGKQIMSALLSGAHERILDADLQRLWKEMGWKGSVKARHFVLALRDYFIDQFNIATVATVSEDLTNIGLLTPPPDVTACATEPVAGNDQWTLDYINVGNVQPIIEVIDDDGTGFISIKEANTFAAERPKGWTLLHWLAFWAKGWQRSISRYQNQIYLIIQEMHRQLGNVKTNNRFIVDWYLFSDSFRTIEQLLRSTQRVDDNEQINSNLERLTELYVRSEEERLERNLQGVDYNIDSPATVSVITGQGRIERHVYPLLFLLLRHHLRIVKAASAHILHINELDHWAVSLDSIVTIVKQRAEALGASGYKTLHLEWQVFYRLIWESPDSWNPSENSIAYWQDQSTERDEGDDVYAEDALKLLYLPPQNTFSYTPIDFDIPPFQLNSDSPPYPDGLEGIWTGQCHTPGSDGARISVQGTLMLRILSIEDGERLTGKAVSPYGTADAFGSVESTGRESKKVIITIYYEGLASIVYCLTGKYDPATQTIEGTYEVDREDVKVIEEVGNDDGGKGEDGIEGDVTHGGRESKEKARKTSPRPPNGRGNDNSTTGHHGNPTFVLRRTPPELYRFLYSQDERIRNPAKARWSFACKSALYLVKKRTLEMVVPS
ncbi:hypothetical protein NP233_g11198 [Leucocoprinus birnbaumii]|uniref:EF-hand domain-containing protein n=1 Tax=Leucocoprinus birnbaumii TaxID=56174 RepID=A0AAD5VH01_9AGAR|nr:hypothetical protein NP233_g11198 [Leucocoprinus birnbaumii]